MLYAWQREPSTYAELHGDHPVAGLRDGHAAEAINESVQVEYAIDTYTLWLRTVFWKTTLAKSLHGRPKDAVPVPCTTELSITYQLGSSADLPDAVIKPVDMVYRRKSAITRAIAAIE